MWCCSRHSGQVPLSCLSEALLLEPCCVFWQLWTVADCFYILQLVLPTMVVIVTTVLIWLVLVSTALHATVIHCRGMYVAVSCQAWYSCSVTYPWVCNLFHMKLLRNSAFLILKFTVWDFFIYFSRFALFGTIHLEQPWFCFFVTIFSLHEAYFIFLWCIEQVS
jgi:hypothetical protein